MKDARLWEPVVGHLPRSTRASGCGAAASAPKAAQLSGDLARRHRRDLSALRTRFGLGANIDHLRVGALNNLVKNFKSYTVRCPTSSAFLVPGRRLLSRRHQVIAEDS